MNMDWKVRTHCTLWYICVFVSMSVIVTLIHSEWIYFITIMRCPICNWFRYWKIIVIKCTVQCLWYYIHCTSIACWYRTWCWLTQRLFFKETNSYRMIIIDFNLVNLYVSVYTIACTHSHKHSRLRSEIDIEYQFL